MTVEEHIYALLKDLVSGRVFPDVADIATPRPYITYQQIGGDVPTYTEQSLTNKANGIFQINVFADSRMSAKSVAGQVEESLIASSALQVAIDSAPRSTYDEDMNLFGTMQDFNIWSDR